MRNDLLDKFVACTTAEYIHIDNDASYAVRRDGEVLTLLFEKSNGFVDWWNNFDFPAKPYREMKNLWFCHRGFLKVWKSIEPYIVYDILDSTITKIDIIGYSHGGAVAQLCYEYVKYHRPDVEVTGVGFGAPRVLWGFAQRAVMKRFAGFVVVRNGKDIVTYLPPCILGFRHIGKVLTIGKRKGLIADHYADRYQEALAEDIGGSNESIES